MTFEELQCERRKEYEKYFKDKTPEEVASEKIAMLTAMLKAPGYKYIESDMYEAALVAKNMAVASGRTPEQRVEDGAIYRALEARLLQPYNDIERYKGEVKKGGK